MALGIYIGGHVCRGDDVFPSFGRCEARAIAPDHLGCVGVSRGGRRTFGLGSAVAPRGRYPAIRTTRSVGDRAIGPARCH